ncbi:protein kinase domain-containing protein [Gloeobacter morelensis]|uniref:Protein kinase n=1 Tax=Gloeobacter morelensis MG652769 TaxID=2781736 RepID=A0ABY3PLP6_9CYAN|nr:protein kinase [Gloeobacter morelensis]UFP94601.1 protein kinase [Gloeobacter morelensis MG652769]
MTPEDFQRLEACYQRALDLPPDQRESFLRDQCPEQLRAEVRALLAADDSRFLEQPPVLPALQPLAPGQVIDLYRIVRLIGEGGMGAVYEAQRVDVPRRCSLKVIRTGSKNAALEERFQSEKNILAQLDHPNIARWLDSRRTAEGLTYLVMDYVEGETIDRYCDKRQLTVRERVQLFRQVCLAVRHAHRHGVVHRDLKPGNILVEAPDGGDRQPGTVKLLDFGIAKLVDKTEDIGSTSTLVFTPNYASPEQLSGEKVGRASDLYALGVIFYQLLAGRLPFERSATTLTELQERLATETVLPPSRAVREEAEGDTIARLRVTSRQNLVSRLRGELDAIVLKLLERDKAQRYAGADELLKAIDCYLGKQTEPRLPKLAVAAVAMLASGLGGFWWWQTQQVVDLPTIKAIAVLPFTSLDPDPRNSYFIDGITEDISTQLGKIAGLNVICNEAAKRYRGSRKSFREIAAELKVGALVIGSVRRSGKRLRIISRLIDPQTESQIWAESFDRLNDDVFAVQSAVAINVARVLRVKLTAETEERIAQQRSINLTAYDYYLQGRRHYALYRGQDNDQAIALFRKSLTYDSRFPLAYAGLADALAQGVDKFGYPAANLDEAIRLGQKAIELDPLLAEGHKALGLAYLFKGWLRKARVAQGRAIELNPNFHAALANYAYTNAYLGEWKRAVPYLIKAQRLNPTNAYSMAILGVAYSELGLYTHAREWLQKAIDTQPDVYYGYSALSRSFLLEGKYNLALKASQDCLRFSAAEPGCLAAAGDVALYRRDWQTAYQYYHLIEEQQQLALAPSETPQKFVVSLGFLYLQLGQKAKGRRFLDNALQTSLKRHNAGDEISNIALEIASIYSVLSQEKQALYWLHKAFNSGWLNARELEISPLFSKTRSRKEFRMLIEQISQREAS